MLNRGSGGRYDVGIGALDLWAGRETVAVFDADTFDSIFADLVHINDEGSVLRVGRAQPTVHVPFTSLVIDELWASGRVAPETSFSLRAAWQHRDQLLAPYVVWRRPCRGQGRVRSRHHPLVIEHKVTKTAW